MAENPKIRYQEKLFLNRQGCQSMFKAVTREKRNNTLLGNAHVVAGTAQTQDSRNPEPKLKFYKNDRSNMNMNEKTAFSSVLKKTRCRSSILNKQQICPKLIHGIVRQQNIENGEKGTKAKKDNQKSENVKKALSVGGSLGRKSSYMRGHKNHDISRILANSKYSYQNIKINQ